MFFKIASLGDLTDVGKNVAKAGDPVKDVVSALKGITDIDDVVNILSRSGTKRIQQKKYSKKCIAHPMSQTQCQNLKMPASH